jgi:DNA-binding XRE family transcriptional regulator
MDNNINFDTVKSIRIKMGMNQEEFAQLVDIPLSTYKLKEQGKNPFLFREIQRICRLTGVDINRINEV